jgi:hypothetical protein
MTTYEGIEVTYTILHFGTGWRWVTSFTPRPPYPRGKNLRYSLYRRLCGTQNRSGRSGEEKLSCPSGESNPGGPDRRPSLFRLSYSDSLSSFVWCETWSLTLSEKHRLRVYVNRVLRAIFGLKRDEIIAGRRRTAWRKDTPRNTRGRREDSIKIYFNEIRWGGMYWIHLAQVEINSGLLWGR